MDIANHKDMTLSEAGRLIVRILRPEAGYFWLAIVYGVAIALLGLATPVSVQLLINSVANTALPAPLFVLSGLLLLLLVIAAGLSAARVYMMALFERRAFARLVAEITLRTVDAKNPFFADARRADLFNRFFDLVMVQNAVPHLLIGGFAIVLQSAIGLVLTSFYHPFFLAFNGLLITLLLLVWSLWVGPALRSAVKLSHAKHETARWLESVGTSQGFYQNGRPLAFALSRSEAVTAAYVRAHRRHFRHTFAQTLGFLLLYAVASAALLALGGWLILQGQLSLGQLVAAELVLSGVFYGISQLGAYLETFYDLVASLHELSLFDDIEQEGEDPTRTVVAPVSGSLRLRDVEVGPYRFNLTVASGEHLAVLTSSEAEQVVAALLGRSVRPRHGLVTLGGADLCAFGLQRLRSEIRVLDRSAIAETTIREYLSLADDETGAALLDSLELVGLSERIARLPHKLDTTLSASGWPLSVDETMALKLAAVLLRPPKLLMLSSLYDLVPPDRLQAALGTLRQTGTTVLQFTRRPDALAYDGYLLLRPEEQIRFADTASLVDRMKREGTSHALAA
ncbi:ABC transporter transmembrane domain-containing protein [Methylorubrum rhodesianum]|uniref:ABC transporter transmembrane domain-containing protein n=1 Tax=Methylorubrum rhodesianum TaxID=29427 RepID=UPI003D02E8A1